MEMKQEQIQRKPRKRELEPIEELDIPTNELELDIIKRIDELLEET